MSRKNIKILDISNNLIDDLGANYLLEIISTNLKIKIT